MVARRWLGGLLLCGAAAVLCVGAAEAGSLTASHGAPEYVGGKPLAVSVQIAYDAAPTAMGFRVFIPSGWKYLSAEGTDLPDIRPRAGAAGTLEFAWLRAPVSPASFSYTVEVPEGEDGQRQVRAEVEYRLEAGPIVERVVPDPLRVGPAVEAAPSLAVVPAGTDLGAVETGGGVAQAVLRLSNRGAVDLRVSRVALAGDPGFEVDATGGPSPCGRPEFVVVPGGGCGVAVAFRPSRVGPATATITIVSNDPQAPSLPVTLTAVGLQPPEEEESEGEVAEAEPGEEQRPQEVPVPEGETRDARDEKGRTAPASPDRKGSAGGTAGTPQGAPGASRSAAATPEGDRSAGTGGGGCFLEVLAR